MNGWTEASIGDLAVPDGVTDGPFGSNLKTAHYTDQGPRVIRLQNVGDARFIDARAHISTEHFGRLRKHEARAGDLVVALLGEVLPRACLVPSTVGPSIVKADCARVRIDPTVASPKFVCFALNREQLRRQVGKAVHGVGRPRITLRELKSLEVPLAPRPEQDRIVAVIEEQLSRVDAGVAALERLKKALVRYRASVLKAACEGRLVPTEAELARAEGRSYEPASELLARILAERRARWDRKRKYVEPATPDTSSLPAVPEGWVWATVEQVNEVTRPCAYGVLQPGDDAPNGIPFVRVGDIDDGKIDIANLKRIARKIADAYPRTRLEGGEVLLTLVGTIGRTAVAPKSLEGANVARAVGVIPIAQGASPNWIEVWFRNPARVAELTAASHEVARKTLNLEDVRRARVALPPLAEQHRIVTEVERRLSIADEVAATVDSALARAARLRQSILKRAFEGKLVPQDPNDEPASVLLARIRAEREVEGKSRPKRKRARV